MLVDAIHLDDGSPEAVMGDSSVLSSASKALALLEAIAQARGGVIGVSEVASAVGMPKSTTHRLLQTLADHGLIGRIGSKYRIGNRFFELSEAARWSEYGELRDLAIQPMSRLFERSGATVHLAVLIDTDVLYLEKFTGPSGCRLPTRVGARFPATCTALGKVILAFSDPAIATGVLRQPLPRQTQYSLQSPRQLVDQLLEARQKGFAYELEEARLGASCVAAPVIKQGQPVAAMSVSLPTADNLVEQFGRVVCDAAAGLSRLLTPA